jgi:FKBP-type peptidyl-prolyl cis-trans isomerase 2
MAEAKNGDTVRVHYTGKLDNGTVFGTSVERDPLEFTIGEEQIIPALEQAVVGMQPGESKTTKITADKAYGQHREEMVVVIGRDDLPANLEPEVGQHLQVVQADGKTVPVSVTDVSESSVTLDANHPLAGEDLTFDIELMEIV